MKLTGNSSFWFQTPVHCLCSITALILIKAGSATQPAEKLGEQKRKCVRPDVRQRGLRCQLLQTPYAEGPGHWTEYTALCFIN